MCHIKAGDKRPTIADTQQKNADGQAADFCVIKSNNSHGSPSATTKDENPRIRNGGDFHIKDVLCTLTDLVGTIPSKPLKWRLSEEKNWGLVRL